MSAPAPVIEADTLGKFKKLIIDTGASVSLLQSGASNFPLRDSSSSPYSISGESTEVTLSTILDNQKSKHEFDICHLPMLVDGLFRNDFLRQHAANVSYEIQTLLLDRTKFRQF
jgi:hypothetical protein